MHFNQMPETLLLAPWSSSSIQDGDCSYAFAVGKTDKEEPVHFIHCYAFFLSSVNRNVHSFIHEWSGQHSIYLIKQQLTLSITST